LKKGKKQKIWILEQEGRIEKDAFEGTHTVKTEVFGWARETEKRRKENFFDVDFFRKGEKKRRRARIIETHSSYSHTSLRL